MAHRVGIGIGVPPFGFPKLEAPIPVLGYVSDHDSRKGITIATGVSNWAAANTAAAGTAVAQADTTKQPAYVGNDPVFGGKPSLSFDGSNDYLVAASANAAYQIDSNGQTILIVHAGSSSASTEGIVSKWDPSNREWSVQCLDDSSNSGEARYAVRNSADTATQAVTCLVDTRDGAGHVTSYRYDHSTTTIYVSTDGGSEQSLGSITIRQDSGALAIGALSDGLAPYTGKVARVIIYDSDISNASRLTMVSYLQGIYGL